MTTWPQEHPGTPTPLYDRLYRLCGALPPGAEDGDCCCLPMEHEAEWPHDTDPEAFDAWKEAHGV